MDLYGIKSHLDRAKTHLQSPDDNCLRYSALELRFCLEIVAYRQLQQYGDVFPGSMVGVWKADQLIKLLASFDPLSNQEGELSFAPQTDEGVPSTGWKSIGKTKAIPWKKFKKYYNKLGSYLHAPAPKSAENNKGLITKESFEEIISALEEIIEATLILAVKAVINAKCGCGNIVYIGQSEFDNDDLVICGNTKCNSVYLKHTTDTGEQVLKRVDVLTFNCTECNAKIPVLKERIWAPTRCPNCSTNHRLNLALSRVQRLD